MNTSTIPRQKVESSQLAEIGHDANTNTLSVQFHPNAKQKAAGEPGSVYHYSNFTAEHFKALLNAESHGSHFIKTVKANPTAFPYKRIS